MTQQEQGAPGEWFCLVDGKPYGPAAQADVVAALRAGRLGPATLVWRQGMAQWVAVGAVAEFAAHLPAIAPGALPPPLPRTPPVESPAGRKAAAWIFGFHDDSTKAYHQGRLIGSIDSLIFGFLSLIPVFGVVFAIMSIPVATKAIRRARTEPGRYSGTGMAVAGLVLSCVSLAYHALFVLFMFIR
ncbi:MAG: GYF domain-containing protein [Phycisphaerae bacterium]